MTTQASLRSELFGTAIRGSGASPGDDPASIIPVLITAVSVYFAEETRQKT